MFKEKLYAVRIIMKFGEITTDIRNKEELKEIEILAKAFKKILKSGLSVTQAIQTEMTGFHIKEYSIYEVDGKETQLYVINKEEQK